MSNKKKNKPKQSSKKGGKAQKPSLVAGLPIGGKAEAYLYGS